MASARASGGVSDGLAKLTFSPRSMRLNSSSKTSRDGGVGSTRYLRTNAAIAAVGKPAGDLPALGVHREAEKSATGCDDHCRARRRPGRQHRRQGRLHDIAHSDVAILQEPLFAAGRLAAAPRADQWRPAGAVFRSARGGSTEPAHWRPRAHQRDQPARPCQNPRALPTHQPQTLQSSRLPLAAFIPGKARRRLDFGIAIR